MYKKIVITLFLAIATLHTVFWLANKAIAAPLDVCPSGCTYTTIQSAVDSAMPFDTVNVAAGTYAENVVISKSLTIHGADTGSTIVDGADIDSVFTINGSVAVTITNMTITNGMANFPTRWGGGIRVEQGDVTLESLIVSNNFASEGGGISSSGGKLTILNSQIMNNIAGDSTTALGGGIDVDNDNAQSHVLIVNTTIANNIAATEGEGTAGGGGISSSANSLLIENSTISGNSSSSGVSSGSAGGILINGSTEITKTTVIRNSTISSNNAVFAGGGVYITNSAEVTLTNSTIVSNTATLFAGGITSFNNGNFYLRDMLIALNSPSDCDALGDFFHSQDHNLDSDDSCSLTEANDLPATLPLIGPLQDNGGSTNTHALLENSPAINAGSNANCPSQDQRGLIRPQGPACDIGAYEFDEGTKYVYLPMIFGE